jgi:translation initiation factor eIF-2B subunit delta
MGNAIRWLKLQISKLDIDLADSEAAQVLCRAIDQFIETRSTMAEPIIAVKAVESFSPTEVILTYAHHRLVELALLLAQKCRYKIKVIVVDDPYERTGLNFAKRLSAKGFEHVTYSTDLGGLRTHLRSATRVLLGAEAIFSNGAMYARAGTCDIAVAAKEMNVPLTALCETINFTERVATDSLTYNEIDPERCTEEECRLLFDTTRPEYIDSIITELGWSTPASAAATLRKLEEL